MTKGLQLAKKTVQAASDKKAKDLVVLKVDEITVMTDYFVILTAANRPQAQAIAENIQSVMKEEGETLRSREGYRDGTWILLDYGDAIVHIFLDEQRHFYDLESLWSDAERIDIETWIS